MIDYYLLEDTKEAHKKLFILKHLRACKRKEKWRNREMVCEREIEISAKKAIEELSGEPGF